MEDLAEQIAARVGQVLERRGLVERDIENAWLAARAEPGPLDDLIGSSRKRRKKMTTRTEPRAVAWAAWTCRRSGNARYCQALDV